MTRAKVFVAVAAMVLLTGSFAPHVSAADAEAPAVETGDTGKTAAEPATAEPAAPSEDAEKSAAEPSSGAKAPEPASAGTDEGLEPTEPKAAPQTQVLDEKKGGGADIPLPKDKTELAAFKVFEKHCQRCHQTGRLTRATPAKNFGNVLMLEQIAAEPGLILPGNPEGSNVYNQIADTKMPFDCFQESSCPTDEPTEDEIKAIYDWILAADAGAAALCADREPIDEDDIVRTIAADLDAQQDHRRQGMRYITLSHLYNACGKDDTHTEERNGQEIKLWSAMDRYRQGVVKLLNSLSRESEPLRMRALDDHKTIIAFNLDDLGWDAKDWDRLIAGYPYGIKPETKLYDSVAQQTNTPLPWLRGDYFANRASRPPLYYDLLRLPQSFAELERAVGVDTARNIERFAVKRAGFQRSGVSKHNRLIERHNISTGYFWTSYDFKGDAPEQSLFEHPLGPQGADAFRHDGGESIYSLPNGFQAYYLNTAPGARLDKGPQEIVLDDSQDDRAVTNGISCFGCHNQGIRKNNDDVRKHVLDDKNFPRKLRDAVEDLYPTRPEMQKVFNQDAIRYRTALKSAGLDLEIDSQNTGIESINLLSKQYEKALNLRLAAAEFGITPEELDKRLAARGDNAAQIKRLLEQTKIQRQFFEKEFRGLIEFVSDREPLDVAGDIPQPTPPLNVKKDADDVDLTLTSDKSSYRINDLPVFTVRSRENCNLTLINVDATGDGVVIFPNKFQQDNALAAGKEFTFPSADSRFDFRMAGPAGTESVIAICTIGGKSVDGIKHDFKKRDFTEVGNYREFAAKTRRIVFQERAKAADAKQEKPASGKLVSTAETDSYSTASGIARNAKGKLNVTARTAIKIEVR